LTLSPSLDLATRVAHLCPEAKLRCSEPDFAPGGGGINVARAIHKLGGSALAIFPFGGGSGEQLVSLLNAEAVPSMPLPVQAATRQCFNVFEQSSKQQFRFVMPAVGLSDSEQDNLLATLTGLQDMDYLVVSGSQPQGLHSDFIPQLLQLAASRGTRCILDSSGQALRQTLDVGGAWLIKPNLAELAELAGSEDIEPEELASIARQLVCEGRSQAVLVSLGAQGALLVTANLCERIVAPTVRRLSTVGAGDSLVAAVTLKLAAGWDWLAAARYGVAAGTAAIMAEGSELCRLADTERLYAWLEAYAPASHVVCR
jgi:6-phosphofructokinase 2